MELTPYGSRVLEEAWVEGGKNLEEENKELLGKVAALHFRVQVLEETLRSKDVANS